jgi:hypothetical protein
MAALPPEVPTPDSDDRYHPFAASTLVVSHHLGGLRASLGAGLLHPTAEQDSLCFRRGATRCLTAPGPTRAFPTAHSHPSKLSPRWQPCRITATVASAAFADTLRASPVSRPTLACRAPTRTVPLAYECHLPDACPLPSHAKDESDMDRRPTGARRPCDLRLFLDRTALVT